MLLFTDGCCLRNGSSNPQGGCAFVFQPTEGGNQAPGYFRFHLEARGPTGERYPQTSNRAELRATIAALRYRAGDTGREGWYNEGFKGIVVATDSAYVVEGITKWVRKWIRNGWQTSIGEDVKNKDLWQRLLVQIETFDNLNVKVQFWRIPRHLNTEADYHAKKGATKYKQEAYTYML